MSRAGRVLELFIERVRPSTGPPAAGSSRHKPETVPATSEACNHQPAQNVCKATLLSCLSRGSVVLHDPCDGWLHGLRRLPRRSQAGPSWPRCSLPQVTADTTPLRAGPRLRCAKQTELQRSRHAALLALYASEAALGRANADQARLEAESAHSPAPRSHCGDERRSCNGRSRLAGAHRADAATALRLRRGGSRRSAARSDLDRRGARAVDSLERAAAQTAAWRRRHERAPHRSSGCAASWRREERG